MEKKEKFIKLQNDSKNLKNTEKTFKKTWKYKKYFVSKN